jgi:hypothetical protein
MEMAALAALERVSKLRIFSPGLVDGAWRKTHTRHKRSGVFSRFARYDNRLLHAQKWLRRRPVAFALVSSYLVWGIAYSGQLLERRGLAPMNRFPPNKLFREFCWLIPSSEYD